MEDANATSYVPVYDEETTKELENEFSRIKEECYLDHAGATLYSDTQMKSIANELCQSLYANPHSIGAAANVTQDTIERMRYVILDHFHTSSDDYTVIFTSNATASLKIIADTFLFTKEDTDNTVSHPGHFVYTQDNHTSVLGMREIVVKKGAKVTCLSHDKTFEAFQAPMSSSLTRSLQTSSNSLFVYPAQCNFSGLKYPLNWIAEVQNGALTNAIPDTYTRWYVLLDAAAYVSTNDLDLSIHKPDFLCLSFYKMFGYPTGIGALLVKNSSADALQKVYYGGGTVDVSLSSEMFHVKRKNLHQRFEDGTAPFLSIISLRHGFDMLASVTMDKISKHVFSLAKFLHYSLLTLHHSNGTPAAKLYSDTTYDDRASQGGIVAFNLLRPNGDYVGYMEVLKMAALFNIHLRTGCFCNPGACQRHLSLSNKEVLQNYEAGYVCGGAADLINGKPTGAVRASFGYMSTIKDAQTLLLMIRKCFMDGPGINKVPDWWLDYKTLLHKKYRQHDKTKQQTRYAVDNNFVETVDPLTNDLFSSMSIENSATERKCILEQLYIYPIKSCAAYKITGAWSLNSKGLQYDREWMIVTSAGTCLTQKQCKRLCLLKPIVFLKQGIMQLNYPGMPSISVPLSNNSRDTVEGTVCQSRICGHKVEGTNCGSDVSEWLSLALVLPNLKLIKQSDYENKTGSSKPELSFSSQAQYLLINKASVSWLCDKGADTDIQKDTIINRFRANMVLSSCEPFEETQWKRICIEGNNFVVTGPCTRCEIICIDQTTGIRTVEPLRTLARQFHGKLNFGIYLYRETKESGIIAVGNTVHIS